MTRTTHELTPPSSNYHITLSLERGGGMPKGTELARKGFRATNRSLRKQPLLRPDFIDKKNQRASREEIEP
ncbi:hypothetical protein TNCV_2485941 [Trichonephila clavipes]|uniref:Uncharacterized protein n=1 Tax=Trichonephila clavipes TaxID=2585209 RepID=A0A8X7BCB0_TRICX|nr:hypothetical protein TNCV_2485941 [Trichonephila clavipes]